MDYSQIKYLDELSKTMARSSGKLGGSRGVVQDGQLLEAPLLHNSNYKVDVDRGCIIRFDSGTGAAIYMYCDTPGVYYNEHAKEVPPAFAAMAGYDIEALGKEKRKRDAIVAAGRAIEAEYNAGGTRDIVLEEADYRLVHLGGGRYNVEWEDGTPMNTAGPVSEEVATRTFWALVGKPDPALSNPPAPKKG